jgi:hypothetical protein
VDGFAENLLCLKGVSFGYIEEKEGVTIGMRCVYLAADKYLL